ncbi:GntR family transcriptional regulator [Jiangella asiatica]|uniref:GntR family transcriptional regulator n=1 Tax=Jiangella asiatica TaxID=2530372 RepID=UPI00193E6596|nr:GntR family transcriptional regulator [Jiangella asiatica]
MRRSTLKYLQVRDYLRSLVGSELRPGDPVPSERVLCERFGVSRMTVRQAVDALVVEGILERVQGRGTFVAPPKVDLQIRLASFTEEMTRRGMTAGVRVLSAGIIPAEADIADALEVKPGAEVIHLHRLRFADDEPMAVEHTWLPAVRLPGFLDDGSPSSVYVELDARGLVPDWGEDTIDAGEADHEEARLLTIKPGKPVLRISRRAFTGDQAIEYSRSAYRSDRYTLWVPVARPNPPVVPRRRQGTIVTEDPPRHGLTATARAAPEEPRRRTTSHRGAPPGPASKRTT